jgi:hypothetical protein
MTSARAFPQTKGGTLALSWCVVLPAILIVACIGTLVSGQLSPRSPHIATITLIVDVMSVIEVASLAIFLRCLIKSYIPRTPINLIFALLGGISLLPAIAVAVLIVDGSFRHVGV